MNSYQTHQKKVNKNQQNYAKSAPWKCGIMLQEFMAFFGILIHITLHPISGQDYTYLWDYPLSNNNGITNSDDHLFKVRPMLNILKKYMGHI
eukprot:9441080-Ditylum_brightwellii.AAC.2